MIRQSLISSPQDLTGSIFSFAQLVIASVFIEHDPSGIVANPAKLGLSLIALSFDLVFIVQNYWLYPGKRIEGVV
jgi:cystinosin